MAALLVVDADAHMTAKQTMVHALDFENFSGMCVTSDERAHQKCGRSPLVDIFPTKNGVPFVKFVMQVYADSTVAL